MWCQWFQVPIIEASIVFLMHWILICLLNSGRGRLVRSLCVLRVLRPPWICPCQLCCTVDSQKLSFLLNQARARKGCNLKILRLLFLSLKSLQSLQFQPCEINTNNTPIIITQDDKIRDHHHPLSYIPAFSSPFPKRIRIMITKITFQGGQP